MADPKDTPTRSILNRLSAVSAAQEQLQGDVDKLRATANALLVIGFYTAAIALLVFLAVRWPKSVGAQSA